MKMRGVKRHRGFCSMPFDLKWLPGRYTQRTNCVKTVTEIIPCFYRYFNHKKTLCIGEKPANLPPNKAVSKREWKSVQRRDNWKNPVLEGQKYLDFQNSNPDSKYQYQDVADEFGVSRARVSQMMSLIKKLPQEILEYFYMENNSNEVKYYTERKLRPLTLMDSDKEKVEKFKGMVSNECKCFE